MQTYKDIVVKKFEDGQMFPREDLVIKEYPLTIFLNGEEFITLMCTPDSLDYLVLGFLSSQGFIESKEDIRSIKINEESGIANIEINRNNLLTCKFYGKGSITTGGGQEISFYSIIDALKTKKIYNRFEVSKEYILKISSEFNKRSELFIKTGGVHSCLLCNKREVLIFHEDVGRHNAIDKVIGEAFIKDINLDDKIIFTSGRMSSEMLLKSGKARIPIVVSRSAPTDLAVDIARELGITLVGFARGEKMTVYSHGNRILI